MNKYFLFFFLLFFCEKITLAQSNDSIRPIPQGTFIAGDSGIAGTDSTIVKPKHHSPMKALLFSAVLPGLGQAYNRKYWKIPIIYAGIGGLGYLIYFENNKYQGYRKAYIMQVDGNPYTQGIYNGTSRTSDLEVSKNYYRRNLDLACVGMFVWYALNLVDATVDGHLFHFDVSDDLSMNIRPEMNYSALGYNTRSTFTLGFKFQLNL